MATDPFGRPRYYLSRRIKWEYYRKLLESLAQIGITEAELHPQFARFKWQEQRKYLERHYTWLFYCVRCHLAYSAADSKHPKYKLCIMCAEMYNQPEDYVYDDDTEAFDKNDTALSARRRVQAILAAQKGEHNPQARPAHAPSVDDIMNIRQGIKPVPLPELPQDEPQHDPPLDVSIPEPTTKE